jgi:hypothetical protein
MADLTFEQLIKEFSNITDDVETKIEQGLNEVSEDLLNLSVNLAPKDQGFLRQSGSVDPAIKQGNEIVSRVGFNTEYALHMHEDFYRPSVPGTGRKYLEKPTMENAQRYSDYLADKVRKAFD